MSVVARYLFVQTLQGLAIAGSVISSVIILIDFVETSRDIATRANISAIDALGLSLLKAPLLIQDTLPFIVLFGVLLTFFRLNRRSELIIMRASGYSAWRILTPTLILSVVVGLAGSMALNPLGAMTNARFELLRERILDGQTGSATTAEGPVWLRETRRNGYTIITAVSFDADDGELTEPLFRVYLEEGNGAPVLDRQIQASTATLVGGFWTLTDAVELSSSRPRINLGEVSLPTGVRQQALFERSRSPQGVSFWRLPEVIYSARQAGLSTKPYELRLSNMLASPLMLIAAALLAVATTLRLVRLGGAAIFAMMGGLAGFVLYFVQELFLNLGTGGKLDTITATWTAPALFTLAAVFFIATKEDG